MPRPARDRVRAVGGSPVGDDVAAVAALDRVDPVPPVEGVDAAPAGHRVGPAPTLEGVAVGAAAELIRSRAAEDTFDVDVVLLARRPVVGLRVEAHVLGHRAGQVVGGVEADAAVHDVGAPIGDEGVVASFAVQDVVTAQSVELVAAVAAVELIGVAVAGEGVVMLAARQVLDVRLDVVVLAGDPVVCDTVDRGGHLRDPRGVGDAVNPAPGANSWSGPVPVERVVPPNPSTDVVVVPVGGGGLVAGIATAVAPRGVRVIGVEPVGSAALVPALEAGEPVDVVPRTIASGWTRRSRARNALAACRAAGVEVVTVPDEAIAEAMRRLYADAKLACEPAGAAAVAAVLAGVVDGDSSSPSSREATWGGYRL